MAKAAIRKLKEHRFNRWLAVEVWGKPEPKQPIKKRPIHPKLRGLKSMMDDIRKTLDSLKSYNTTARYSEHATQIKKRI